MRAGEEEEEEGGGGRRRLLIGGAYHVNHKSSSQLVHTGDTITGAKTACGAESSPSQAVGRGPPLVRHEPTDRAQRAAAREEKARAEKVSACAVWVGEGACK